MASIYVLDEEEALDFYVNKLGLEKGSDVRQGDTLRERGVTDFAQEPTEHFYGTDMGVEISPSGGFSASDEGRVTDVG